MTRDAVTAHYSGSNLLERLRAALIDDGIDPDRLTIEALAPYDHFHGRGVEATREMAEGLTIGPADHLLDIGSGIGGPARWFADRYGCRVTGIDLTAEFCAVARQLTDALGLEARVSFEQGNALAMPFADAAFSGAYSMNVSMNIADKDAFYREVFRVLRPGGWLMLSELARGDGPPLAYPTPWAATERESFLATPAETRRGLEAAGFTLERLHDTRDQAFEFGVRSREAVERGGKPLHRAVMLIHGAIARDAMANSGRALKEGSALPIEVLARRPR